jgi:transcription initiation factor TFIIIB Brf1 subunit/transcription initiation factor TFIIB
MNAMEATDTEKIKKNRIRRSWKYLEKEILHKNPNKEIIFEQNNYDLSAGLKCWKCNDTVCIMDDGIPTCLNPQCGIMNKDILDYSPEWNSFGKEDKVGNDCTRCGNPANPLLKESSSACKVFRTNKCSYEMRKIDKWIEWQSMPHKEKTLYDEFQYITNIGRIAGIPNKIIDEALIKHKEISEEQMFRGANRDSIKAASIYIAYRLNGYPRTALEISKIFLLDKKSASKGCSMAVNILNNIERYSAEPTQELCKITPAIILDRYCSPFPQFNQELVMLAKFIAHKIEKEELILDNTPQAIASGIIYFINQICHLNIPKTDIIQKCQISDVTIIKCYKKMMLVKESLIPLVILEKYEVNSI